MNFILFFCYIFLSQFPSLIKIGSSYIGLQIFILPLLYLNILKIRQFISYLIPILSLSTLIGLINYSQVNISEVILRFVGLFTLISSILLPIDFYNKANTFKIFKHRYVKKILLFSLPNLIFCFFEVVWRLTRNSSLRSILIQMKDLIFVRGRGTQVVGTITGLFPEHGLFAPFLLFILGISFLFVNKIKMKYSFLISFSWISIALLHSSGLFLASLFLTFLIYLIIFFISLIQKLTFSKNSLKYFILFISIIFGLIFIGQYTHPFLFKRFSDILGIYNLNLIAEVDKSLGYKLLPYFVFFKSSFSDLMIGSGLGYYSQFVIERLDYLPSFLFSNDYFLGNLNDQRFPLNSTIICSVLEYGLILWLLIFFILQKFIKLFNPIKLFINYRNILNGGFKLNEVLSIIFLMASFLSIFGAVPLTYPFPYLSLSLIFILFDAKEKGFDIS
tara:strand:- start:513 stop:1850 length:1338 start_codon:yes stop_codon:yes gene_type:complete